MATGRAWGSRLLPSRRTVKCSFALLLLLMLIDLVFLLTPLDSDDSGLSDEDDDDGLQANSSSVGIGERGEQGMEVLSWKPRVFMYHNFLSKEECEHLIELAKPHLKKSLVIDTIDGQSKISRHRTSSGMFIRRGQDKVIKAIEKRIADFTFIPVEHGEGLQVLHYEVGQKYEPHLDLFLNKQLLKNGGQRSATIIMYLSDVEEGGETVFPSANVSVSYLPRYNELSECGKKGLSIKPKKGDALLFWSLNPDGTEDPLSVHGGCPVIKGSKWSSTKWMHVGKYSVRGQL